VCNVTHLSTTSSEDLAGVDGKNFVLEKISPDFLDDGAGFLEFPSRWFVACRYGGCSCHFRNWARENPPEFGAPEEWCEEDPEDVEATGAFYDFVAKLVRAGHQVDTVTVWTSDGPFDTIWTREVSLSDVSREAFRFIENYRFRYVP
jgi:hypothetical protein